MARKAKNSNVAQGETIKTKTSREKRTLGDKITKLILTHMKKFKDVDIFDERAAIEEAVTKIEQKLEARKAEVRKENRVFKKLSKFNEEDIRSYLAAINN